MSNGKGSHGREFNKKGHGKVLTNWDEPYPERKVGKPGKTTYVWRNGKLVDKSKIFDGIEILPIPDTPSEYAEHRQWLEDQMLKRFAG